MILEQEFNTSVQSTRIHRFGIYPTTISSGFRISGLEGKATVLIFDINGRKALQQEVTGDEFISTDALPAGSFIVKIVANGIHEQQKLLKLYRFELLISNAVFCLTSLTFYINTATFLTCKYSFFVCKIEKEENKIVFLLLFCKPCLIISNQSTAYRVRMFSGTDVCNR